MDRQVGNRIRSTLLNLHLYGGLASCWYLVLFGFTSLGFNHAAWIPKHEPTTHTWDKQITPIAETDTSKLAEHVRDESELVGWVLEWTLSRDDDVLRFEVHHPGRHYQMRYNIDSGQTETTSKSAGLWSVLRALHGLSGIPNSTWMKSWFFYTEFTTWAVLFSAVSGVYLWYTRAAAKRLGIAVLALSTAGSLAFMAWIYWVG